MFWWNCGICSNIYEQLRQVGSWSYANQGWEKRDQYLTIGLCVCAWVPHIKMTLCHIPHQLGKCCIVSVLTSLEVKEGAWSQGFQHCGRTFLIAIGEVGVGVILMSAWQWLQELGNFGTWLICIFMYMGTPLVIFCLSEKVKEIIILY